MGDPAFAEPLRAFMHKWNAFSSEFVPKNISDSLKVQEILPLFIKAYRQESQQECSPKETLEVKRRLILSLLCTLHQSSLISP